MAFANRLTSPQFVQCLALLAALGGVVVWSTVLLQPTPSAPVDNAAAATPPRSDNPALQWFANRPAQIDIKVAGVMASVRGAVAILTLNDGPPRSFLAGEQLTQGVRLLAIERDGVLIEHGVEKIHLAVTRLSETPFLPSLTRP